MTDNGKAPYVTFMWLEKTWEYRAQFWKDYKLVDEKRLTSDEEATLDTYLSFVSEDSPMDVSASELWELYHDGDLPFEDEDSNFLWMLNQIMPEPEEV
jgi:hypothetical protein